jgi:outer membrane protein OmpA-like peptidoglycan-associated protein
MSFNILDAVKGHLTPDLISKAGSFLGESNSGVTKAIGGIIPTVLSGLISKASSGGSAADEVFNMAKDAGSSGILGNIGSLFSGGGGSGLSGGLNIIKGLFGGKLGGIISTIAGFAGIKESSVSSLMSMAAPVSLGTLGKHASENGLNASGLLNLLNSQKSSILNMLPGGLSGIAGLLGLGNAGQKATTAYNYAEDTASKAGGGFRWLLPLLGILLAGLAAWYFLFGGKSGCTANKQTDKDTVAVVKPVEETAAPVVTAPESFKVTLPDGTELNAWKGGIEDKLVSFLNTDWMKLGEDSLKKVWFDFDNLNFETGSAKLTAESQAQVNNMAAILKAFPAAKLKIGGYTDKVGNEAANKKLSGDRANAVKSALEKAGVGSQITGAEGYGSEFAKYPADAPESDRVKDRHVSVSVRG